MTQKYRVGVLFGGRSSEHEVSLASAQNVMDALRQAGHTVIPIGILPSGQWLPRPDAHVLLAERAVEENHGPAGSDAGEGWGLLPHAEPEAPLPDIDVIFPVLHGPYGEDGTVQGLLEMANLPYIGCGVLASALAMDKIMARRIFAEAGLPQVRYAVLNRSVWRSDPNGALAEIERTLAYPMFVKPANLGSSVGISKARDTDQLAEALNHAARFDRKILIEEAVANAREIEVSVLGNADPMASVPGEIIPGNEFYDYEAKYIADNSELVIPAKLDAGVTSEVRKLAIAAFKALDCEGLARVDFLLDGATNQIYLNEANTMPGFTRISMYPKLWEATGISYPELVDRLVHLAIERYSDRQENCTTL